MNTHGSKRETTRNSTALPVWIAGAAVALAALSLAAGGLRRSHPSAPGDSSASAQRYEAPEVTRIDEGVVRSIDANTDPDTTGASVAAYER